MEKRETERVLTYTGEEPADGALPAFYTNIDEQGNVLFLDEERLSRKSAGPSPRPLYQNKPNGLGIKNFIVTHTSARQWNWKVVLKVFKKILDLSKHLGKPGSIGDKLYRKAMMFDPPEDSYSAGFAFNLNVDVDEDRPGTARYNNYVVHKNPEAAKGAFACKLERLAPRPEKSATKVEGAKETTEASCSCGSHHHGTTSTKTIQLNETISNDIERDMATVTLPIDLVKKAIDEAEFIGGMKECLCRAGSDCQS